MQGTALPKMIVLQNKDGEHLGALLLAIPPGSEAGDCVFMILPPNTALWNAPDVAPLFARKDLGESEVQVLSVWPVHLRIQSAGLPPLVVQFTDTRAGTWAEEFPGTASGLVLNPRG